MLNDRIAKYYKNPKFCERGCEFQSIDYDNMKVKCNCSLKTKSTLSSIPNTPLNQYAMSNHTEGNYNILKCIDNFFIWSNLKSNPGFIVTFSFFCIESVLYLLYLTFESNKLYSLIINNAKPSSDCIPSPPIKESIKEQKQNKFHYIFKQEHFDNKISEKENKQRLKN